MRTTTFNQIIDGETFCITVPANRVETILNRVDRLIEKKKFDDAIEVVKPFVGATEKTEKTKAATGVDAIIESARAQGRYAVIEQLVASGMSKASAYYRARKAGL